MRAMGEFRRSWIGQYFNYDVTSTDGIVHFTSNHANSTVDNYRFNILMAIRNRTCFYFLPISDWKLIEGYANYTFFPVEALSHYTNGFLTKAFPYSTSAIYDPPYFVLFDSIRNNEPNYLKFNGINLPCSKKQILSMLHFNTDSNTFEPVYAPEVSLSSLDALTFNQTLELSIVDSKNMAVDVDNGSQLFIALKK